MWRTIAEEDAVEITKQRHRDIYLALRAGDADRASAADSLHLAEGEDWLRRVVATGDMIALSAEASRLDGNGRRG
jgi:DNA-binding FadR family transcriptional regulator